MSDMWKEFKEFAVKGNAIDLAVGVIIGAAFGGIITSLVKDILMPPIGLLTGGLDFSNKFVVLKAGANGFYICLIFLPIEQVPTKSIKFGQATIILRKYIVNLF